MTLTWRKNALAERHRALGSNLEPWNGMPTPWEYHTDPNDDYLAVRTKAGLMDISGLNIAHVVGAHAEYVLQRTITRDIRKLTPGKATYATMLDDRGMLVDDGIVYSNAPNYYTIVHGSGTALEQLNKEAVGRDVAVIFDSDQQVLSLQGPVSVEFLERHIPHIRDLKYFRHWDTTLFNKPVKISRTGYTGEKFGYEIYCASNHVVDLWDRILEDGADLGIVPAQFSTLDMFRTEHGLLFFPEDMSNFYPYDDDLPGDTLWELGLEFTVSPTNTEFRGRAQHDFRRGKERVRVYGVEAASDQAMEAGDRILDTNGKDIGLVTSGMYSPHTNRSVALVRIDPAYAKPDIEVSVAGKAGKTHALPFEKTDRSS